MGQLSGQAAHLLREIFAHKAKPYPRIIPKAEITFRNNDGGHMSFSAQTPAAAASYLQHCMNNDGIGIFNRSYDCDMYHPLSFQMYKRVKLKPDDKEHVCMALSINYRSLGDEGCLWLSDPEMRSYYWHGDHKLEDKPPKSFIAPRISDLIMVLNRAGEGWHNVNFMRGDHGPKLRLVAG